MTSKGVLGHNMRFFLGLGFALAASCISACGNVVRFTQSTSSEATEVDSTGRGWFTPQIIDLGGISATYVEQALTDQDSTYRDFELRANSSQAIMALAARSGANTRAVIRRYSPQGLGGSGWEPLGGASTTFGSTAFQPTDVLVGIGSEGQAMVSFWSGATQLTSYLSEQGDWRDTRTAVGDMSPFGSTLVLGSDGIPLTINAVPGFWNATPTTQAGLDLTAADGDWEDRLFAYGRATSAAWDDFGNAYAARLYRQNNEHFLVTQKYVPDSGWSAMSSNAGELLSVMNLGTKASTSFPQVQVLEDGFGITVLARTELDYAESSLSLSADSRILSQWIVGNSVVQGAPNTGLATRFLGLARKLDSDANVTDVNYAATLLPTGSSLSDWGAAMNSLLIKLDQDTGVTDTDYAATYTWTTPSLQDRRDAIDALLAKLDLDSGVTATTYSTLGPAGATLSSRITLLNNLLTLLDSDASLDGDYVLLYQLTGTETETQVAQRFNSILQKLDDDTGVSDTDYESTLVLDLEENEEELLSRFNNVLAKLDANGGVSDTNYAALLEATSFGAQNFLGLGLSNPQVFSAASDGYGNVLVVFYDAMPDVECSTETEPMGEKCNYRLFAAVRGATGTWIGPSRIDSNIAETTTTFYQGDFEGGVVSTPGDYTPVQGGMAFAKPGVVSIGQGQFLVVYAGTDLLARSGFVKALKYNVQSGWDLANEETLSERCLTGSQSDCSEGDLDYAYRIVNEITAAEDRAGEAIFVLQEVADQVDLTDPTTRRMGYRAFRYSAANGGWAMDPSDPSSVKLTWLNELSETTIPYCRVSAQVEGYDLPNCNRGGAQAAIFSTGEAVIVFAAPVSERTGTLPDVTNTVNWTDTSDTDYENTELYTVEYR